MVVWEPCTLTQRLAAAGAMYASSDAVTGLPWEAGAGEVTLVGVAVGVADPVAAGDLAGDVDADGEADFAEDGETALALGDGDFGLVVGDGLCPVGAALGSGADGSVTLLLGAGVADFAALGVRVALGLELGLDVGSGSHCWATAVGEAAVSPRMVAARAGVADVSAAPERPAVTSMPPVAKLSATGRTRAKHIRTPCLLLVAAVSRLFSMSRHIWV